MTPRPKRSDSGIAIAVARKLVPKLKQWQWIDDETALSEIQSDLEKVLRWDEDGYELARALDGNYTPDAAMVEILDEAGPLKSNALRKAETEWVTANNIQPIPLQTKVLWKTRKEIGVGIVTENHPDGKSTVAFASQGHVIEPGAIGRHGLILEWENLDVLP